MLLNNRFDVRYFTVQFISHVGEIKGPLHSTPVLIIVFIVILHRDGELDTKKEYFMSVG